MMSWPIEAICLFKHQIPLTEVVKVRLQRLHRPTCVHMHTHVHACKPILHTCTHVHTTINLLICLHLYLFFHLFLLHKQRKQKHQSYEYSFSLSTEEIFSISTLNRGNPCESCTYKQIHTPTHNGNVERHIMHMYVSICTIRTMVCNFQVKLMEGRRTH